MDNQLLHNIFDHDDCLDEQKLLDYVNNSLSNILRNEVERHTINCKFCSDAVDGFMGQENSAANYKNLKQNPFYRKRKTKTILWLSGVAASILVVLIVNNLNSIKLDNQFTAERDTEIRTEAAILNTVTDSVHLDHQPQIKKPKEIINLKNTEIHKKEVNTPLQRTSKVIIKKSEPNFSIADFETDNYAETEELKIDEEIHKTRKVRAAKIVSSKQKNIQNKLLFNGEEIVMKDEAVQKKSQTKADLKKFKEDENTAKIKEYVIDDQAIAEFKTKDTHVINYKTDSVYNLTIQEINEIAVSSNSRKKLKEKSKLIAPSSALDSAIIFYENKEFENVIKQLNTVKNTDPDYFKAQLYIGKSNLKLNRPLVAREFLTEALNGNKKTEKEAETLLNSIK